MNAKDRILFSITAALFAASAWCAPVGLHNAAARASGDKLADAHVVTDVRLDSGSGKLSVSATVAGASFIRIAGQTAVVTGGLMTLAIDADHNAETGKSAAFVNDVKGVESQVEVNVCGVEKSSGGTGKRHCVNGFWGDNLSGASAEAVLAGGAGSGKDKAPIASADIAAPGKTIALQIPYQRAGLAAGDTVRIYVLGWKGPQFGLLFKPVTLKLR